MKEPEQRYETARLLRDDLRKIRRDTETTRSVAGPWPQPFVRVWQELRRGASSRRVWYGAGLLAVLIGAVLFLAKIGFGNMLIYGLVLLFAYRFVRNRPQHALERLAKRLSKIPEVRLVVFRDHHADVVVDSPAAQLYSRINRHVRECNRTLFYGTPLTVSIIHDVTQDRLHTLLTGPGVQYVRPDVLSKK